VRAFVERWVQAQNDADFDAYAALYAEDFSGIKRVADKETRFDREGWLADRRRMFERDQRVVASNLEVLRGRDAVGVSFDQAWSSSTFSDRGRKLLTLRQNGSDFRIAREQMLSSELSSQKERSGACAALSEQIESGAGELRYFANIASAASAPEWAAVTSLAEANERAADGTAWQEWTLAMHEGWRLASRDASSPSDDWVQRSELCFRADGTLAQLTDTYRTFYSELGMIEVSSMSTHAHDGAVLSRKSSARVAATGQPAAADSYQHIDPPLVMKFEDLPFAALLR
jgi:ketosteroid isomerase-like protein